MFPKKSDFKNLELFPIIGVNADNYLNEIEDIYQEKIKFFKMSLLLIFPIIIVLTFFFYNHFKLSLLMTGFYLVLLLLTSFFMISIPIYRYLTADLRFQENNLKETIDTHLTELANQEYFTKNARAKRLLNQEFQLIKLQPVKKTDINMIKWNEKISSKTMSFYHIEKTTDLIKETHCFYQNRPLKPIVLVTIAIQDKQHKFRTWTTLPIEFELVDGLVSEQITFLEKDDYIVNPKILIDRYHFRELYDNRLKK
ncbi:hypothetical protein CBF34_05780 [Vagococcus penaei]|uniref:Uncharacterized protein n=1 Tax=Vagococcus penaei TaxID=633807 RepID=A0A1Q2D3N5_9ENTE|nr:hypothetical protein [Vagococcus penaei]AQP52958.1 hypothetical protein BW732_01110 [Vagococcus penaei]RSU02583.1 hypothetical protein CBF34_05780 [Vagococcus penaei]